MATLTVSDHFKVTIESRATTEGFETPEAYLEALMEADSISAAPPEHLSVTNRDRAVALVRQGLASPAQTMTQADLDQWRRDLIARHSSKAS